MQKLLLSIPEPCHQNWQHMTPTDQGRFCNACAKEVVDFSMMTDTEVLNYFTTLTHDKVCGRALPSQLERTISRPKEPTKRLFWYWNYIVMFLMFFGKGNTAKAQGSVKQIVASVLNVNDKVVTVGGGIKRTSRQISNIISGKVTDKDGNPVSFATIKIKNSNTGLSADAKGVYTIKVNTNAVLIISAASFKTIEVPVGNLTTLSSVLEKTSSELGEVVVTVAGGVRRRNLDNVFSPSSKKMYNAAFIIKDSVTGLPINLASIILIKIGDNKPDTVFSDNNGKCKLKRIKGEAGYHVRILKEGYEPYELTVNGTGSDETRIAWEVFLKKQKVEAVKSTANSGTGNRIRLGGMRIFSEGDKPIYVIDGTITKDVAKINPNNIEDITVLQASNAIALFGAQGANGAIIVTTKQLKVKILDTVVVSSDYGSKRTTRGGIGYTNTYQGSFLNDTIAIVKTLLTNSIKVYPNPVQRNTSFSVALQLKQAGNYSMQVTDASGRILLQQKFNDVAKDHTEKVMSNSRWVGGVYYIRVFDAQHKLINKSSFIIQ